MQVEVHSATYQAMEVVQALDVHKEASAVPVRPLDVGVCQTTRQACLFRYDAGPVYLGSIRSVTPRNLARVFRTYSRLPRLPTHCQLQDLLAVDKCLVPGRNH